MSDAAPIRTTPGRWFVDCPVGADPRANHGQRAGRPRFRGRYDPQPMHIDKTSAGAGRFGGLIAISWHTGRLVMIELKALLDQLLSAPAFALMRAVDDYFLKITPSLEYSNWANQNKPFVPAEPSRPPMGCV